MQRLMDWLERMHWMNRKAHSPPRSLLKFKPIGETCKPEGPPGELEWTRQLLRDVVFLTRRIMQEHETWITDVKLRAYPLIFHSLPGRFHTMKFLLITPSKTNLETILTGYDESQNDLTNCERNRSLWFALEYNQQFRIPLALPWILLMRTGIPPGAH